MTIHKRSGSVAAGVKSDEMLAAPAVISSSAVKRTVDKLMNRPGLAGAIPTALLRCFWKSENCDGVA
jgi:hypothetical protein